MLGGGKNARGFNINIHHACLNISLLREQQHRLCTKEHSKRL